MSIFGVIFVHRDKNTQALLDLEIMKPTEDRVAVLQSLTVSDFSKIDFDTDKYGKMWVFGKTFKNKEVYIKISMGNTNQSVFCISFHIEEYIIKYKFKTPNKKKL